MGGGRGAKELFHDIAKGGVGGGGGGGGLINGDGK